MRQVTWSLTGGPCAGHYDAYSTWPPPATIRAVHGPSGTAVLDLEEDVVDDGEELVIYKLAAHGFMCDRGRKKKKKTESPLWASYFPESFTQRERTLALRQELANIRTTG